MSLQVSAPGTQRVPAEQLHLGDRIALPHESYEVVNLHMTSTTVYVWLAQDEASPRHWQRRYLITVLTPRNL